MSGSRAARARAAVDLAVPRSPRMSTPPIWGLMAFSIRARRIFSWPTMALKGNMAGMEAPGRLQMVNLQIVGNSF